MILQFTLMKLRIIPKARALNLSWKTCSPFLSCKCSSRKCSTFQCMSCVAKVRQLAMRACAFVLALLKSTCSCPCVCCFSIQLKSVGCYFLILWYIYTLRLTALAAKFLCTFKSTGTLLRTCCFSCMRQLFSKHVVCIEKVWI